MHVTRAALLLTLVQLAPTGVGAQLLRSPSLALGASIGGNGLGFEVEVRPIRRAAVVARADGLPISDFPTAGLGVRLDVIGDRFARVFVLPLFGAVHCPEATISGSSACRSARWYSEVSGLVGSEIALSEKGRVSLGIQGGYMRLLSEPTSKRLSGAVIDAVLRVRVPFGR